MAIEDEAELLMLCRAAAFLPSLDLSLDRLLRFCFSPTGPWVVWMLKVLPNEWSFRERMCSLTCCDDHWHIANLIRSRYVVRLDFAHDGHPSSSTVVLHKLVHVQVGWDRFPAHEGLAHLAEYREAFFKLHSRSPSLNHRVVVPLCNDGSLHNLGVCVEAQCTPRLGVI